MNYRIPHPLITYLCPEELPPQVRGETMTAENATRVCLKALGIINLGLTKLSLPQFKAYLGVLEVAARQGNILSGADLIGGPWSPDLQGWLEKRLLEPCTPEGTPLPPEAVKVAQKETSCDSGGSHGPTARANPAPQGPSPKVVGIYDFFMTNKRDLTGKPDNISKLTDTKRKVIAKAIAAHGVEDCKLAICGALYDETPEHRWMREKRLLKLEWILRMDEKYDNVERYAQLARENGIGQ